MLLGGGEPILDQSHGEMCYRRNREQEINVKQMPSQWYQLRVQTDLLTCRDPGRRVRTRLKTYF